ncbi:twin-arginine translocase TatA/TatE family subunit [Sphingomonas sp. dw_22]|uniref:twin-arginine translocase TatA/TatE family subunit n=1 Tax=Sphingomonas sp. dw_22 TaxID=2721175 RepID=UPI001BD36A22|nr:twin-arginine translocase TatA/TatE family subunit [Sphingomonas sp. dw_22]
MGSMSLMHWLIVGVLVILLFGGSRFSNMMGDVAKGIKQFKKGMAEDDDAVKPAAPTRLEGKPAPETGFQAEAERTREEQR